MAETQQHFSVSDTLHSTAKYLHAEQKILRLFWLVNFVLLALFRLIDQGFSNPLSILWLVAYYVYWCIFFRVYYRKKPYFSLSAVFGSMAPSSKMLFMTLFAACLLVILPFLPLLMGFNDRYLLFFERYMEALQNIEADVLNQVIFGLILLLLSPIIVCRPFLAWLAALQGLNGSIRKAFHKTQNNYGRFVLLMIILDLPCALVPQLDALIGSEGWFSVAFYSIFFIFFNLVFARLYDFFYREKETRPLPRQIYNVQRN